MSLVHSLEGMNPANLLKPAGPGTDGGLTTDHKPDHPVHSQISLCTAPDGARSTPLLWNFGRLGKVDKHMVCICVYKVEVERIERTGGNALSQVEHCICNCISLQSND